MRRVFTALVAVLGIALLASEAASQCNMTHTAVNGGYELCGVGGGEWEWTGPGGFSAATQCVTVSDPGTYTLRIFDGLNGVWGIPCTFSFSTAPTSLTCMITGADSVCAGSSTTWCGPQGGYFFSWTGPGGFTGATYCVDVSVAGDYSLTITDFVTGAVSAPCTRTLTVTPCGPPHTVGACPSSARWWGRSCERIGARLDAATFAHIATLVDERSDVWSYGGSVEGFCALLRPRHDMSMLATAKRHYAAVLANLSAAELGVTAADGHAVGLDASASLAGVRGVPANMTVGDWVSATESRMLALAGTPWRDRSARGELRRIAREAHAINRMPGSCGRTLTAVVEGDDDDLDLDGADMGSSAAVPVSTVPRPNPLSGATSVSFTLERSQSVELTVMDIAGRRVRHLASGVYAAGVHDFSWDGHDDDGRAVRAGAYFVAGRVGDERLTQRLFILR